MRAVRRSDSVSLKLFEEQGEWNGLDLTPSFWLKITSSTCRAVPLCINSSKGIIFNDNHNL